jgi:hypothetical protein
MSDSNQVPSDLEHFRQFLGAHDRWKELARSWQRTPRAIAGFEPSERAGPWLNEVRERDANEATEVLRLIHDHGIIIAKYLHERGYQQRAKLIWEWVDAQCRPQFDSWTFQTWERVRAEVAYLLDIDGIIAKQQSAPAHQDAETLEKQLPKTLLTGWHGIMAALDRPHNQYGTVKSLNERMNGPIVNNGQGKQPMVYEEKLIEWWNNLAELHEELENKEENARLSAQSQHNFGRDGTVAPEIGGSVKKRRSKKQT